MNQSHCVKPFLFKSKTDFKHTQTLKHLQYLDMDYKSLPLWLVLQWEVEGSQSAIPIIPMGLVHSWGGRLAGEGTRRWREVTSGHYPRLSEPCMGRWQLQVWGASHLLVVVVEWLGGDVAIQIPFLQIQMQSQSGTIWTWCQFTSAGRTHWWRSVAVSINVSFTGVVCCCGSRCSKLLLAAEAFRVDVDPFEHVHKLVGGRLLSFCVFSLATDPGKGWHSEDKAEDAHHSYTYWHSHCGGRGGGGGGDGRNNFN